MKTLIGTMMLAIGLVVVAQPSMAEDKKFAKKHPRRAEVLKRANNEENKNNAAAVNGKITDAQAKKLDRQDQRIKAQEQADARANGGTITKKEQRQLNREENNVNRERGQMEKADAAKAAGGTPPTTPPTTGSAPTAPSTSN